MLEHILDVKHWGGVEWVAAFVLFNAIAMPLAFKLDFALFANRPRLETAVSWVMLPVLGATACWWWAEDLQKAGLPSDWAYGLGAAVLVLLVGSVAVRVWMVWRAARLLRAEAMAQHVEP